MDFKRVSLIEEHHSYSFQQQAITQLVAPGPPELHTPFLRFLAIETAGLPTRRFDAAAAMSLCAVYVALGAT